MLWGKGEKGWQWERNGTRMDVKDLWNFDEGGCSVTTCGQLLNYAFADNPKLEQKLTIL